MGQAVGALSHAVQTMMVLPISMSSRQGGYTAQQQELLYIVVAAGTQPPRFTEEKLPRPGDRRIVRVVRRWSGTSYEYPWKNSQHPLIEPGTMYQYMQYY